MKVPEMKKLTTIGKGAFQGCTALTKITIPAEVTKIGANAFSGCGKLKNFTIKAKKLKTVGKNAFKGTPKGATYKCPSGKAKAYEKLMKKNGAQGKFK
jgi:hypothetical protein